MDLNQYILFPLCQHQPGIPGIALKQAALFQAASDALAQGVDGRTELTASRRFDLMEACPLSLKLLNHPRRKP